MLTMNEARWIAINIARLPELLGKVGEKSVEFVVAPRTIAEASRRAFRVPDRGIDGWAGAIAARRCRRSQGRWATQRVTSEFAAFPAGWRWGGLQTFERGPLVRYSSGPLARVPPHQRRMRIGNER
jgi:hypothetical protein